MNVVKSLVALLFGASWKSSLLGLAGGLALAGVSYAQSRSEPGWYLVALALAALGRVAKDANVSNAPTPGPAATVPPQP